MVAPAWALPKGPKLMVGILHIGQASLDWAFSFREHRLPAGTQFAFSSHLPYDVARNKCVKNALDAHAEWLMFWDTEVIPPPNGLELLLRHNQPIVQGLYYASVGNNMPEVMRRDPNGAFAAITGWPPGSLVPVDTVATGFLLIHHRVLEKFQEEGLPWFEWTVDRDRSLKTTLGLDDGQVAMLEDRLRTVKRGNPEDPLLQPLERVLAELKIPPSEGLSEDFTFGWRAKNLGFPLFVDTQCVCDHVVAGRVVGMGKMRPMTIL